MKVKQPQISVILCTYNRAQSLGKTIESVVAQTMPSSLEWDLLVVDNNSTDETREVVKDFQRRYPQRVRYAFEPQQGISFARNTGVRSGWGEILAFIDDDETADPGWLQCLTAHLFSGDWSGSGGRVVPLWSARPPRWVSSKHSFICGPLAMFNPDTEGDQLTEPPFGANMAFRREIFEQYGVFRTDLGRSGKGLLSGEDTEFGRRVMAAGARMRYEPQAITHHPVEKGRIRKKYFLMWWFNKGRSDVRENGVAPHRWSVLGVPIRLLRHTAVEFVRWVIAPDPCERFVCILKVWTYAGQAFESHRQSLQSKRIEPTGNIDLETS
jgi:glucosyl-dolichyl phosphate glucuronosyltransferase